MILVPVSTDAGTALVTYSFALLLMVQGKNKDSFSMFGSKMWGCMRCLPMAEKLERNSSFKQVLF